MSVTEKKSINRHFERVSAEDVRRAAEYQAAILADVAGRRGTLHETHQTAGPTYVRCGSGRHRGSPSG